MQRLGSSRRDWKRRMDPVSSSMISSRHPVRPSTLAGPTDNRLLLLYPSRRLLKVCMTRDVLLRLRCPLRTPDSHQTVYFCSGTWFKRPLPLRAEMRLSKTSSSICARQPHIPRLVVRKEPVRPTFFCVSLVSVPMWGRMVMCSMFRNLGLISGSLGKTSRPAVASYGMSAWTHLVQ